MPGDFLKHVAPRIDAILLNWPSFIPLLNVLFVDSVEAFGIN
jgi:hypothetical protein